MSKVLTIIGVLAGLGLLGYIFLASLIPAISQGSVMQFNEYMSTSTRSIAGANNITNLALVNVPSGSCASKCPGAVGSVVITGDNTGWIRLWDATTTNVNLRVGATTTLNWIEVPASAPEGTYTFDVNFFNGILLEESGNVATATITWRYK